MKNVKNNASPIITWLGGIWFVANAVRVNDSTITIRVNDVININILGASDSTVNNINSLTDVETFVGSLSEKIEINSFINYRSPYPSIFQARHCVVFLFQISASLTFH